MKIPKLEELLKQISKHMAKRFTGKIMAEINLLDGFITKVYIIPKKEIK